MKPVKYFFLAGLIKRFLQMLFLLCTLVLCLNLFQGLFSSAPIKIYEWTLGHKDTGYNLKAGLALSIPDSVLYFKNGQQKKIYGKIKDKEKSQADTVVNIIVNKFGSYANEDITIRNTVYIDENVIIRAISKNSYHHLFWILCESLSLIFYALILLILIKLTNRYMDEEIFYPRTFKLVSWLGMLLIINELINLIVNYVNMKLIQSPVLDTISPSQKIGYYFTEIQLHPASISFTNIGIGILVFILAQVLRQAIIAKQENELTI